MAAKSRDASRTDSLTTDRSGGKGGQLGRHIPFQLFIRFFCDTSFGPPSWVTRGRSGCLLARVVCRRPSTCDHQAPLGGCLWIDAFCLQPPNSVWWFFCGIAVYVGSAYRLTVFCVPLRRLFEGCSRVVRGLFELVVDGRGQCFFCVRAAWRKDTETALKKLTLPFERIWKSKIVTTHQIIHY